VEARFAASFHTYLPWDPYSFVYSGYRVYFQGVKWPERGVYHPPQSKAEVIETVNLYLYFSSGPSWPVLG